MADLIVAHGTIVTMDAERRILTDGAVAIQGNRIVEIGKSADVLARHRAPSTIDATDRLVIPGLIDGHNHPFQYLSKGIGDDVDILTWLYRRVYPYEATLTAEEAYTGALGNFAQMIRSGTTCFNDPGGYHADSLAQAAVDVGIRGIINRSTRDGSPTTTFPCRRSTSRASMSRSRSRRRLIDRWNGAADGRLRALDQPALHPELQRRSVPRGQGPCRSQGCRHPQPMSPPSSARTI